MDLRLGRHVVGPRETVVMAVPPEADAAGGPPGAPPPAETGEPPGGGSGGPPGESLPERDGQGTPEPPDPVEAARHAVRAGARIIEVAPSPEIVASVRATLPVPVIAVTVRSAEDAAALTDAGAELLIGPPEVAAVAAAAGIGYAGPDPAAAEAAGVAPEGIVLYRAGAGSLTVRRVERHVRTGHAVMVTPAELLPGNGGPDAGPDQIAVAAVCVWLGVRIVRTSDAATIGQVVNMVATIKGDRPPAVSRRGLA